MQNENYKKKNDLMKSIMSNPKMARSFKDAMSSPIGSTKREEAKSILSIMKKVGGLRNDGMGGPLSPMSSSNQSSQMSSPSNSYYIFPAAPKLKSTTTSPTATANPIADIKNMFSSNPIIKNVGNTISSAVSGITQSNNYSPAPVKSNEPNMSKAPVNQSMQANMSLPNGQVGYSAPSTTSSTPTTPEAIKQLQSSLNTKNAGQAGWTPLAVDGIMGPKTAAAQTFSAPVKNTNNTDSNLSSINNLGTNTNKGADTSFASSENVFNIAAKSVANLLKLSPTTSLKEVPIQNLAAAIATNEGYFNGSSKPAIRNNNPGNLKFAGQRGATEEPGTGFAVFKTADEGADALINDLTAKYNSGKYQTINDLMSVYSPDSDNPSNPNYGKNNGNIKTSSADQITSDAKNAVAEGTGPGLFAMNEANAKFGGSLQDYINNLDVKLKKDFNLEPLEVQLSNLKAESENFIPTLTSYMKGKDQYSSAIDKMIDNAESQLTSTNMADPFAANQYQNYMTYLYTLKGRQNERYGNYLNSAISDYNADVTKLQSNYDNVYKNYTDALTRQGTIAQNEYNTLYTTMSDLYTNLENAPIKANNAKILQQQVDANNVELLKNGVDSGTLYPDYYKDVDTFSKNITDKDGVLMVDQIGAGGLAGLFNEAVNLSGDPKKALAEARAINLAMSKGLSLSADKMTDLTKYKKLVNDLSQVEGGQEMADMITPSLNSAAYPLVSDYVLQNLSTIKSAAQQLVEGKSSWLGKSSQPGLKDEAGWKKNFSNINSTVLDDLYNHAQINYSGNPTDYVNTLFSGSGDKNIANNLTTSIMSTW